MADSQEDATLLVLTNHSPHERGHSLAGTREDAGEGIGVHAVEGDRRQDARSPRIARAAALGGRLRIVSGGIGFHGLAISPARLGQDALAEVMHLARNDGGIGVQYLDARQSLIQR